LASGFNLVPAGEWWYDVLEYDQSQADKKLPFDEARLI